MPQFFEIRRKKIKELLKWKKYGWKMKPWPGHCLSRKNLEFYGPRLQFKLHLHPEKDPGNHLTQLLQPPKEPSTHSFLVKPRLTLNFTVVPLTLFLNSGRPTSEETTSASVSRCSPKSS